MLFQCAVLNNNWEYCHPSHRGYSRLFVSKLDMNLRAWLLRAAHPSSGIQIPGNICLPIKNEGNTVVVVEVVTRK